MRKTLALGLVALVALALIAACGGGGGGSQPSGSIKVTMTEFKFDPSDISAPSGKVVFFLVNGGSQAHDMYIRNSSGANVANSDLVSAGDSFVFTVDNIAAGTYTIFCNQPGHESSGMKGTLTIT
ncbi:MAG TPA: plastocyanin/azurin family copper-binding protein [Candidatus Dormibacteraeota bacterium]|nr:plastocyanin/azurin family copper-binding protein [Candidatus Dormibacteraeota bacterium]